MAKKSYSQELAELIKYRKLLYKIFVHKESGDKYQLTQFTLDYATRELYAVMVLCSHTAYKWNVPVRHLKQDFKSDDRELQKELMKDGATV